MSLAAAGDTAAFERLYRTHVARVHALARWLLGASDEVDDAVQDVFIRVWQKLDSFAGQSAFSTWLHRVAVNSLLRRREKLARFHDRHRADELVLAAAPALERHPEIQMAIEHALDGLPDGARAVFVLHDMEGYKHDEIAELLGVDPGTSRSQLHRARMLLRRVLGN